VIYTRQAVRARLAQRVKNVVKRALRRRGLDLVRPRKPLPARLDVLGYVIADLRRTRGPLTFLQVGANDGVRADPLHHLVLTHGLTGVLVEPLPDMFERLQQNYADVPGLAFEQCAVAPEEGTVTLYRIAEGAPLPDWVQGMASFQRSHLEKFGYKFKDIRRYIEPIKVPCRPLPAIIRDHGLSDVDLLQVDTEGYDCTIVLSALEAGLRPSVIEYEFAHAPVDQQARCQRALVDSGYRLVEVGQDMIAVQAATPTSEDQESVRSRSSA